ncbi:DUF4097 family beta strand repeat-containing protein [Clostridium sp. AL.422]|uniref:DUF4097 family beta strand repeat-containing protein n=1 Tax=Clostridium TaxID=1485 RepID=UPI00293DCE79|nr:MULTISPECIES: DUF4097 family beta strand repeat-containing protein [unclassified Clostridium]MDV4152008.1 DUF4097 family beta strand repeat-containing protein [Clostridium sp. AL.422]
MNKSKRVGIIVTIAFIAIVLIVAFTNKNTIDNYEINESFEKIDIRNSEYDVSFVLVPDGEGKVVIKGSNKINHTVNVKNDTLTIIQNDRLSWYKHIRIGWRDTMSITVYLPESEYMSINLKTASGDIEIPDNFSFRKAELLSTSGDISFMSNTSELLSVNSTSGDINLKNSEDGSIMAESTSGEITVADMSTSEMNIKTTSGDINIKNSERGSIMAESTSGDIIVSDTSPYELYLKTTSGDIETNFVKVNDIAVLESNSGDIEIDKSDATSFNVKTKSGDVKGRILSSKKFITETNSGKVKIPDSDPSAGICDITTSSGSIEIEIIP